MEDAIHELTDVKLLENGEYQATFPDGRSPSGINPQNKRDWPSVEAHIEAGKYVKEWEPHVDTPEEILAQLDSVVSRDLEDVLGVMTADQKENFLMKTDGLKIDRRIALDRKIEIRAKL